MGPWNAQGPSAHCRGPLSHPGFPLVFSNRSAPRRWSRWVPGMRQGPLRTAGAHSATRIFHLFSTTEAPLEGGVGESLECPKPFQDVAYYNTNRNGSCWPPPEDDSTWSVWRSLRGCGGEGTAPPPSQPPTSTARNAIITPLREFSPPKFFVSGDVVLRSSQC